RSIGSQTKRSISRHYFRCSYCFNWIFDCHTMRKFGLITDSLNQGNYKKYIFKDASIVSLSFLGGSREIHRLDESNLDLFDMFKNESFDLMKPNLDQFIKAFKKQKALGYEY